MVTGPVSLRRTKIGAKAMPMAPRKSTGSAKVFMLLSIFNYRKNIIRFLSVKLSARNTYKYNPLATVSP